MEHYCLPLHVGFLTCGPTHVSLVVWRQEEQTTRDIVSQVCGFLTIVGGTFLLHATRDLELGVSDLGALARPKSLGFEKGGSLDRLDSSGEGLPLTAVRLHRTQSGSSRDLAS